MGINSIVIGIDKGPILGLFVAFIKAFDDGHIIIYCAIQIKVKKYTGTH